MTEYELLDMIGQLETIFDSEIKPVARKFWIERFLKFDVSDFRRVVDHIISTRKFFPRVATVYKAMDELGISLGTKKSKVVEPVTIYRDPETGYTFVYCNETGRDDDPPKTLSHSGVEYHLHYRAESAHEWPGRTKY
jgi:hypothetical protein